MNKAAFFDLDKTILNISSGNVIFKKAYDMGLYESRELFLGLFKSILYRLNLIKTEDFIKIWLSYLNGISVKDMDRISKTFFHEIKKEIRRDSITEITKHRIDKNSITVILSASTLEICSAVKEFLDIDYILCSELEIINGYYTGKLKTPYCFGEEKLKRALKFCEINRVNIKKSFYYADSIADLPVLEAVGFPVCVNPDKKLLKIAIKKGWDIRHW